MSNPDSEHMKLSKDQLGVKGRWNFKILSVQPGTPGVYSLAELQEQITNGQIKVEWLS